MGYQARRFGAVKVELGDGYWAEVTALTKAEDDECRRILLGGEIEGPVGDAAALRARFHQREYTDQMLGYAIKRWNLDGEDGAPWPIDLAHIQALAEADSTRLLAAVRGLTAPLADPKGGAR